jgi:UDP-3-O-[3-hydroxymyristoyl] glucosamine N-acyltransferase
VGIRLYDTHVLVNQLAEQLRLVFEGDGEREITGAAPIETASESDLSFAASAKVFEAARRSSAGCLIVPTDFINHDRRTIIRSTQTRAHFAC